jgi:hypothetical protein
VREWDRFGKLYLAPASEVPLTDRHQLLPVPKDETTDRIVHDRRPRNAKEVPLAGRSKVLCSGHSFVDFQLGPPGPGADQLRVTSDDLEDYYPSFDASVARARTNALAREFDIEQFRDFRASQRRPDLAGTKVVACMRGLVPGDLNAVDWAQEAHENLLATSGAYQPSTRILNGSPFPRGAHVEALVLDDHVALSRQPAASRRVPGSVAASFARAGEAYERVGLGQHPSKSKRGVLHALALGQEILGSAGWTGAERSRRASLAQISLRAGISGVVTGAFLRRLLSGWTHCLLARRVLLCLIGDSFRALPDLEEDNRVFALSPKIRNELLILALMAPAMTTNLRAQHSDQLVATDASEHGLGACCTPVDPSLHAEFWRHREQRGSYTWLSGPSACALFAHGSERDIEDLNETLRTRDAPIARVMIETFDFIELCCGPDEADGSPPPLSGAVARAGLHVGPKVDIKQHPLWDLGSLRVLEWLLFLVRRGRVWLVHTAAPCTTFSVARCPRLRSRDTPGGFDPKEPCTALGNLVLLRSMALLFAIWKLSPFHGSHEHPKSAYSWQWRRIGWLFEQDSCDLIWLSMCSFGAPFRKDTRLGLVRAPFLKPLARPCTGFHSHVRLEGALCSRAARYPDGFAQEYATLAYAAFVRDPPTLGGEDISRVRDDASGGSELVWFNEVMRSSDWEFF